MNLFIFIMYQSSFKVHNISDRGGVHGVRHPLAGTRGSRVSRPSARLPLLTAKGVQHRRTVPGHADDGGGGCDGARSSCRKRSTLQRVSPCGRSLFRVADPRRGLSQDIRVTIPFQARSEQDEHVPRHVQERPFHASHEPGTARNTTHASAEI